MFVDGIPFFNTYSREIMYITSQQKNPKTDLKMQAIKSIQAYYAKKGFKIALLREYQQFEMAQAALGHMQIDLNASVRNAHFPKIDRLT